MIRKIVFKINTLIHSHKFNNKRKEFKFKSKNKIDKNNFEEF